MTTSERRHDPRTTFEAICSGRVTCVRIDPDIVGIIMNVSAGGLCFQCMTPIERNGTIHFSFMQHDHCMDARGELAWLDGTATTGGLRFTALTPGAREQVSEWAGRASVLVEKEEEASTIIDDPISSGEPYLAIASTSVMVATGEDETSIHCCESCAADQPHAVAGAQMIPGADLFLHTWKSVRAAIRKRLRQRWQVTLDSIWVRLMAMLRGGHD